MVSPHFTVYLKRLNLISVADALILFLLLSKFCTMFFYTIPLLWYAIGTVLLILLFIEVGFRLGIFIHRFIERGKESTVSTISGSILGLFGFILAFIFGILYNRFEARKEMIREEANAIHTTLLRSAFLPEAEHVKTIRLLKEYVDLRVVAVDLLDTAFALGVIRESDHIQQELWEIALANANKTMNANTTALFIQSLTAMTEIHNFRVYRGIQSTAPLGLWVALYSLLMFSMVSVGYQTAIAQSKRTFSNLFLSLSFSIVIVLIYSLDQPNNYFFKVPQQSMKHVQTLINQQITMKSSVK
jgi:hypothetical protein